MQVYFNACNSTHRKQNSFMWVTFYNLVCLGFIVLVVFSQKESSSEDKESGERIEGNNLKKKN